MRRDGVWRKSSRSGGEGNCVEVAAFAVTGGAGDGGVGGAGVGGGGVGVRDSKDRPGPTLSFDPAAWTRFVVAVPAGERDHQL